MPIEQVPKVAELKDISERLVEAIAHQPKVDGNGVRKFLQKARQKDLDQLEEQIVNLKSFVKKWAFRRKQQKNWTNCAWI